MEKDTEQDRPLTGGGKTGRRRPFKSSTAAIVCLFAVLVTALILVGLLWLLLLLPQVNPAVSSAAAGVSSTDSAVGSCAVKQLATPKTAVERLMECLLADQRRRFEPFNRSRQLMFPGAKLPNRGCKGAPHHPGYKLLTQLYNSSQLRQSWVSVAHFLAFVANGTFKTDKRFNQSWTPENMARLNTYTAYLKSTQVMKSLHSTLLANALIPSNLTSMDAFFNSTMYPLWFQFYGRRKRQQLRGMTNSCGFEHTFVGEIRGCKVLGFHNWLQILRQEELGKLHYRGYYGVQREPAVIPTVCIDWLNRTKPINSIMLGVEPEFELALYTATHLLKAMGRTRLQIGKSGSVLSVQNFEEDFAPHNVHSAYLIRIKED